MRGKWTPGKHDTVGQRVTAWNGDDVFKDGKNVTEGKNITVWEEELHVERGKMLQRDVLSQSK